MKSKFFKVILGIFILANLGMAEYIKKNNAVYYRYDIIDKDIEDKVKNVDLGTFKILNDEYAKDANNVYFLGNTDYMNSLTGTKQFFDSQTFEVMPHSYLKDKNGVYKTGEWIMEIEGANPKTIKVLSAFYLKDDKNVFNGYRQKIDKVDLNSFEVLGQNGYYAKDKNSVYYSGEKVEGANAKTFKIISDGFYSKDDKNVYAGKEIVKGADLQTFKDISGTSYARDKNNLYYYGYYGGNIENLGKIDEKNFKIFNSDLIKNGNEIYYFGEKENIKNPEKFEIIKTSNDNENILYGKDDKNVYVSRSKYKHLKVIENADRDTFEVMKKDIRYSKDKNNIYFVSKSLYDEYDTYFEQDGIIKMKGADKNSFVIEKNDFSYDKNSVYFMGKKINGINSAGFKIISNLNSNFSFFLTDNKNLYKYTVNFSSDNRTVKRDLEIIKKPKVDVSSFESIKGYSDVHYRDKNNVYYYYVHNYAFDKAEELIKIEGADRDSFEEIDSEFGKDNKNVYYLWKKFGNISPEGFDSVDLNLEKNRNGVYFWKETDELGGYEIIPINFEFNSASFQSLNKQFADFYFQNKTGEYYKDKNGIYYFDYPNIENLDIKKEKDIQNKLVFKIEGADISTFKPLGNNYSKDKNKVYCKLKEIKGADAPSFNIIWKDTGDGDGFIIKDKNRTYKTNCE